MDSACQFFKLGYCKLKDDCDKVHVKEECKDRLQCKVIKTCSLRHPKNVQEDSFGGDLWLQRKVCI